MSNSIKGLSSDERRKINNTSGLRDVLNGAKQLAKTKNFEIGEVLIVQNSSGAVYVLPGSNTPKKFLVVDKDEDTGVVYAKGINSNGRLGLKIEVLASWDSNWTFLCDPDFAEALLLDNEDGYDAFASAKKLKKDKDKVRKANQKIRQDTDRYEKGITFTNSLSPGDKIWISYGWTDEADEFEIIEAKTVPLEPTRKNAWSSYEPDQHYKEKNLTEKPFIKVRKISGKYGVGNITNLSGWELERFVYRQKPYTLNDVENMK